MMISRQLLNLVDFSQYLIEKHLVAKHSWYHLDSLRMFRSDILYSLHWYHVDKLHTKDQHTEREEEEEWDRNKHPTRVVLKSGWVSILGHRAAVDISQPKTRSTTMVKNNIRLMVWLSQLSLFVLLDSNLRDPCRLNITTKLGFELWENYLSIDHLSSIIVLWRSF